MQKTIDHGFGGKNGHANFKQPYLRLREMKSGPGWLDGNMEERRKGWDRKCWNILSGNCPKMKNTEET
jgi:hypothetical protein